MNNWNGTIADKTASDLPFSPSISTIAQDVYKEESFITPEGMNICMVLCVIPTCYFLYKNNYWDEYHAMCTSYSPYRVMFQVSVLDDDAIASSRHYIENFMVSNLNRLYINTSNYTTSFDGDPPPDQFV